MDALRQEERRDLGRQPEPSAGSIDSQRIKTATQREDIGVDGHKKLKGRTRHLLVDTLRFVVDVEAPLECYALFRYLRRDHRRRRLCRLRLNLER